MKIINFLKESLFKVPLKNKKQPEVNIYKSGSFFEDFKNLDDWIVSKWSAPGSSNIHQSKFDESHVKVEDGCLVLKLSQIKIGTAIRSIGGEVASKKKFGYGIYEFYMRSSSTAITKNNPGSSVSGSITGCFSYNPVSTSEIDVEIEGGGSRRSLTHVSSWRCSNHPSETTAVAPESIIDLPHQRFHKYAFVWQPKKIEFYRNERLIAVHERVVPEDQEAPMMFNHWGTNNPGWGGMASLGIDRYVYVKDFKFVPL